MGSETNIKEVESSLNFKGHGIEYYLYKDQLDELNSQTDAYIICSDGVIPVHRFMLMTAPSSYLKEILSEGGDLTEIRNIHLPDVESKYVLHVLSVLYTGSTTIVESEHNEIVEVFRMLGLKPYRNIPLQMRLTHPGEESLFKQVRYMNMARGDERDFYPPNRELENSADESVTQYDRHSESGQSEDTMDAKSNDETPPMVTMSDSSTDDDDVGTHLNEPRERATTQSKTMDVRRKRKRAIKAVSKVNILNEEREQRVKRRQMPNGLVRISNKPSTSKDAKMTPPTHINVPSQANPFNAVRATVPDDVHFTRFQLKRYAHPELLREPRPKRKYVRKKPFVPREKKKKRRGRPRKSKSIPKSNYCRHSGEPRHNSNEEPMDMCLNEVENHGESNVKTGREKWSHSENSGHNNDLKLESVRVGDKCLEAYIINPGKVPNSFRAEESRPIGRELICGQLCEVFGEFLCYNYGSSNRVRFKSYFGVPINQHIDS